MSLHFEEKLTASFEIYEKSASGLQGSSISKKLKHSAGSSH